MACGFVMMSCGSSSRLAGILLVTSQGAKDVNSYGIDLNTGVLTQLNTAAPVPANSVPGPIVLDPSGNFAYVANMDSSGGSGNISAYSVDKNGKLASAGSNVTTGVNPVGVAIDGGNHFLFVANQGSNNVSVFSIGSNASLTAAGTFDTGITPVGGSSPATPNALAVTPSGSFLYVANQGQNTVTAFAVTAGTGALTRVGGSPVAATFPAGTAPSGLTIDTGGKYLYVANSGSNNVSAFVICASALPGCGSTTNGSLVPVTGSPFSAGLGPVSLAVDPTDNFLYVVDMTSNQLSGYRINPSTGALTALATPAVSTGTTPLFVAIHPAGNYLYVSNNGADTISGFHLVPQSGVLGPLSPATAPSRPAGIALK